MFLSLTGVAATGTSHHVLQSPALANGSATGEFGEQLESMSALLAAGSREDEVAASAKKKTSGENRQTAANAPSEPQPNGASLAASQTLAALVAAIENKAALPTRAAASVKEAEAGDSQSSGEESTLQKETQPATTSSLLPGSTEAGVPVPALGHRQIPGANQPAALGETITPENAETSIVPAVAESDTTPAQADAKALPPGTNVKAQSGSRPAHPPVQASGGNRSVTAGALLPEQNPMPPASGINLLLGGTDARFEQTSGASAASAQTEASTSGLASDPVIAALPDAPGNGGRQTFDEGVRTLKGVRVAAMTASFGSANDFAFAAKMQPASAAPQNSLDSLGRSATETPGAAGSAIRKAAPETELQRPAESVEIPVAVGNIPLSNVGNIPISTVTTTFQQPDSPNASVKTQTGSLMESQTADLQTSQQAQAPASTAPLKDVSLSIAQPQGPNVEVRVVERAGEVRVAVRAGDSDVVQGLRQNLSELTDRLSETGFHAETWRPAASDASAAPSENKDSSGNSPGGDSQQQQQGWSQQGRGQRDQNQSNQPRWVQEFETSLTSGPATTGTFNGLIS